MKTGFAAQVASLRDSSDYHALDAGQRSSTDQILNGLFFDCEPNLNGLLTASATLNRFHNKLESVRTSVKEAVQPDPDPDPTITTINIPSIIKTKEELNAAVDKLQSSCDQLPIRIITTN